MWNTYVSEGKLQLKRIPRNGIQIYGNAYLIPDNDQQWGLVKI
jgi:hypothetical protein